MRRLISIFAVSSIAVAGLPGAALASGDVEIHSAGVVHGGLYSSEWNSAADLNALAAWAGQRVTFAGSFHHLNENDPDNPFSNTVWILDQAWQAQATPFANLEFHGTAAAIASGAHDAEIATWASHVQDWLDMGGGRSLIIAPLQEMNGDWVPYGLDPTNFKLAYQRIVTHFRDAGMDETQVRFAFAPNGWSDPDHGFGLADYYPGGDWVDVIGISAYNFGSAFPNGWESVEQVYGPWLTELRTTVDATKPYLIAQTATSSFSGDKEAWVRDMFSYLAADPNVFGLVYFNIVERTDFPVWEGGYQSPGFRDGLTAGTTSHEWPLTDWFTPGNLVAAAAPDICPDGFDCDRIAMVTPSSAFHRFNAVSPGATSDTFFYGGPSDMALMGDWDCDGEDTPAMFRPSNGFIYLRNSNDFGVADAEFFFGLAGDIPIAGDWDGDGCDTFGIYRPSQAKVYVRDTLGTGNADHEYFYGEPGDRPFVGDFDGDGKDTVGLYRLSTGFVYFRNTLTTGPAHFDFFYGEPSDVILAGDWDGDGDDTVAVYRPSTDSVYFRFSNSQGPADHMFVVGDYETALTAG